MTGLGLGGVDLDEPRSLVERGGQRGPVAVDDGARAGRPRAGRAAHSHPPGFRAAGCPRGRRPSPRRHRRSPRGGRPTRPSPPRPAGRRLELGQLPDPRRAPTGRSASRPRPRPRAGRSTGRQRLAIPRPGVPTQDRDHRAVSPRCPPRGRRWRPCLRDDRPDDRPMDGPATRRSTDTVLSTAALRATPTTRRIGASGALGWSRRPRPAARVRRLSLRASAGRPFRRGRASRASRRRRRAGGSRRGVSRRAMRGETRR